MSKSESSEPSSSSIQASKLPRSISCADVVRTQRRSDPFNLDSLSFIACVSISTDDVRSCEVHSFLTSARSERDSSTK